MKRPDKPGTEIVINFERTLSDIEINALNLSISIAISRLFGNYDMSYDNEPFKDVDNNSIK